MITTLYKLHASTALWKCDSKRRKDCCLNVCKHTDYRCWITHCDLSDFLHHAKSCLVNAIINIGKRKITCNSELFLDKRANHFPKCTIFHISKHVFVERNLFNYEKTTINKISSFPFWSTNEVCKLSHIVLFNRV